MKTSAEIDAEIKRLKKEYQTAAQREFTEGAAELFVAHPRLKSFGWTQYTPYFNDGDSCEFSAHTDDPYINGFNEWDDDDGEGSDGENLHDLSGSEPAAGKVVKAVQKFLKNFSEDYYREAFGDHIKVHVTAKKLTTDEYSHD